MEDGRTYCSKYQESRAGSMLFLSNTYFMTGLTLSLMSEPPITSGEFCY